MIWSYRQQEIGHGRADQELLVRASDIAKMQPPHTVLHLDISEQAFDSAPQPNRLFEETGPHLRSSKVAGVLVLHAAQGSYTAARASLTQRTCPAVIGSRLVVVHTGRSMKAAVRQSSACRAGGTVTIMAIDESLTRELPPPGLL